MERGSLTYAGRVRLGDEVRAGSQFVLVTKINRARGRKPRVGENLHLISGDHVLKYNSTDPVRVRRVTSADHLLAAGDVWPAAP